jgi:hypothetical protein
MFIIKPDCAWTGPAYEATVSIANVAHESLAAKIYDLSVTVDK